MVGFGRASRRSDRPRLVPGGHAGPTRRPLRSGASEFQDYLRYFRNPELAVASKFHIGEIAFYKGDFESALSAFDLVLDQYPKSGKAPDALYLKAKVLEKDGKRSRAVQELNKLVRAYPNSDAANRAQSELKRLRTIKGTSRTTSRK